MKKVLITICLLAGMVLVQGCGNNLVWTKDVFTQEEFTQDNATCKYEATKASYTPIGRFDCGIMSGIQSGMQYNRVYKLCMQAKGWKLVKKD